MEVFILTINFICEIIEYPYKILYVHTYNKNSYLGIYLRYKNKIFMLLFSVMFLAIF